MEKIIVLDFGSQYSQLIARRIRECHVYSQIVPFGTPAAEIKKEEPKGIILSGGPASVYAENAPKCDPAIFELGVPILGICYGLQLTLHTFGGVIARSAAREYGKAEVRIKKETPLFAGLPERLEVWMSHGDKVTELPPGGAEILGESENTSFCALKLKDREIYGLQFHPEVAHTPRGKEKVNNFCTRICG